MNAVRIPVVITMLTVSIQWVASLVIVMKDIQAMGLHHVMV